jgi:very-short-patch-repair endonuclease
MSSEISRWGDGAVDVAKSRFGQVVEYLRALDQVRNPVRRSVDEHPWSYWLRDLPPHPSIRRGVVLEGATGDDAGDDFVLRVRRPTTTSGPPVPADLEAWISVADRSDPDSAIDVYESVNVRDRDGEAYLVHLSDDPRRVEALAAWRRTWDEWAANERPTRRALRVFEQLYQLHGQLEREGEQVELVLGDGVLRWSRPDARIHHPLVLQRVQLEFSPEVPEFVVRESEQPVELYSAVFRGVGDVDGASLSHCQKELEDGQYHPLGGEATSGYLRALVVRLSALGRYLDDPAASVRDAEPEVYRDPVLFLRRRTLGFASALEGIRADLERRPDLPASLLNIMGLEAPPADAAGDEAEAHGPANEVADVLLSKPANPEQVQIARRLQRHGAVLVQGPPGTGKTHTIANLIGHLLAQGKSVLVTSHTSKALRVLHEKIAPQLQALCVSVLGSDAENRELLERSVAGIADRLSSSAAQLDAEARRLETERDQLLGRLAAGRQALLDCLGGEYREIVVGGKGYQPSDAARQVLEGAERDSWIPGEVEAGGPLPLAPGEVLELYRTNAAVSAGDEREIDARLPDPDALPSPTAFARLVADEAELLASDRESGSRYWRQAPPAPGVEAVERLRLEADAVLEGLDPGHDWKLALVEAGRGGGAHRQVWDALIDDLRGWYEEGAACERLIAELGPELPEGGDDRLQLQLIDEMRAHAAGGGKFDGLSVLFRPKWKRFLATATVDGRAPSTPAHFDALRALIALRQLRRELRARWDRVMAPVGGPGSEQLGDRPEQAAARLVETLQGCLAWHDRAWSPFEARLAASGFDWPALLQQVAPDLGTYGDLTRLRRCVSELLLPALRARAAAARLCDTETRLGALADVLSRASPDGGAAVARRLHGAVGARDTSGYEDAYGELVGLHSRATVLARRRTLLHELEAAAPTWAARIAARAGVHGEAEPPGDAQRAWRWTQLRQQLDRRAASAPAELQRQIEDLRHQLESVTAELIDRRAWSAQLRRVGVTERQALVGWLQTVKKIGKGTGKRAPKLMAEARRQMATSRSAVPVWIMPLARVVENFDPATTRFDVVVIDEASQSDAMALIALYLGRQVLVVGDEEQVSPDAVGQDLAAVEQLIAQYLPDVPNGHLYDGRTSVYDLAAASFGGSICLLEHFRCVPEIIEFSNGLSYDHRLKPLRDGSGVRTKPPVIAHRVSGYDTGRNVNPEEASTVAALIAAAIEQPEYADATFGVISMVGERQALEVERLLRTHLPPSEYARRRIVCGNPAQFQGDERDVMFLSLVDSPAGGPLAMRDQPLFKKRYNVAASRARDQMWVVHSLDPAVDLKPGDLRRRLIEHALDPESTAQRLEQVEQRVESEFERRVAQRLVTAGYRVVPQWRVGYYRIDLVVVGKERRLAVECDGDRFHPPEKLPEDMERQAILERLGWIFARVRGSEYFRDPEAAMRPVFERLTALGITPEDTAVEAVESDDELRDRVVRRAAQIRRTWDGLPDDAAPSAPTEVGALPPAPQDPEADYATTIRMEEQRTPDAEPSPAIAGPATAVESQRAPGARSDGELATAFHNGHGPSRSVVGAPAPWLGPLFDVPASGDRRSDGPIDIPELFQSRGIPWKDNRDGSTGAFWVTGGPELRTLMADLKRLGLEFRFTPNGSKATGHKPGWFLQRRGGTG